jgi:hypothetical protein
VAGQVERLVTQAGAGANVPPPQQQHATAPKSPDPTSAQLAAWPEGAEEVDSSAAGSSDAWEASVVDKHDDTEAPQVRG